MRKLGNTEIKSPEGDTGDENLNAQLIPAVTKVKV